MPKVIARGIPATIWAASNRLLAMPWAIAFQLGSRESITSSRPYFSKNPFSLATTKGAQSVKGIKPISKFTFSNPLRATTVGLLRRCLARFC